MDSSLPPHPGGIAAPVIPMHHFGPNATFGDFHRHFRHRCLGFEMGHWEHDVLYDPQPSLSRQDESRESNCLRDVPLSEKIALSRKVGLAIHWTRNKALLLPSIRKLGLDSQNNPLPPEIIDFLDVGRLALDDVPCDDEIAQTHAFQREVYSILNLVMKYKETHLTPLAAIAPYRWKQLEEAPIGGTGGGGFGRRGNATFPCVVIHLQQDTSAPIAETKSTEQGAHSIFDAIQLLADDDIGYSKSRVAEGKTQVDAVVRQMIGRVSTRHPLLYNLCSYNRMVPLKVRPPSIDRPWTSVEVGDVYLRYPQGEVYDLQGNVSTGTPSMATALLAMTFHPVDGSPWDWEDSYEWPSEKQVKAWTILKMQDPVFTWPGKAPPDGDDGSNERRRSERSHGSSSDKSAPRTKQSGKRRSTSPRARGRGGSGWVLKSEANRTPNMITGFPEETHEDAVIREFFLDQNKTFEPLTQPNHPLCRRLMLQVPSPSRIDKPTSRVLQPTISPTPIHLTFGGQIGKGHLGNVFRGSFTVGTESIDVAIKVVFPDSFYSENDGPLPHEDDGYPVLSAEGSERLIRHEAKIYERLRTLQGFHLPTCYGLWQGLSLDDDKKPTHSDMFLLITELLSNEAQTEARSIITAYERLHAAGIIHGDVERRHWIQGRLIDFETAVEKPKAVRKSKRLDVFADDVESGSGSERAITSRQRVRLAKEEKRRVAQILDSQSEDDDM